MSKRNKVIALTSLMTLALIVFIGITYTFFTALITGDSGSNTIIQTASMNLLFTDEGSLIMYDSLPGSYTSNTFLVQNKGDVIATYNVRWREINNEFINDELIMKLECNSYNEANTLIGSCGVYNDIVGNSTKGAILQDVEIPIGITHRYTMTITFIETGDNQNYNQGKTFNGAILIDTININEVTIRGILVDENDNILANKLIEIHSDPISVITNSKGEFAFEGIEYGEHEIIIKDNNTEIARKNIIIEMTNNNSKVTDSTSIYWNESQRNIVKVKIETNTNTITKIDLDWGEIDARCFKYDGTSTSITDYYCYKGNNLDLPTITDVVIPRKVNDIALKTIEYQAFESNNLTSVTIPDGVTTIRGYAFWNNELTSVIIPDSVTLIGNDVFQNNNLTNIIIPDSVTSIGYLAFYNNKLTSVDYPGGIEMGGGVFNANPIELDDPIMYYKNKDGSYNKSIIIGCITDETSSVIIPNNVSEIKSYAFYGAGLTGSITIPNSISLIERYTFHSNKLSSVIIPDSVNLIDAYAFYNNQLSSVTIGNSVTSIENNAFMNNKLVNVIIPNSVTSIKYQAFYNNQLTNVTITNNVKTIGNEAFRSNNLTNVTIPYSVTTIGNNVFYDNPNLSLISIDNVSGAISGSPWGASKATITYLRSN